VKLDCRLLLRVGVTVIMLLLILSVLDLSRLIKSLEGANISFFLAALALMPLMVLTKCYRWYLLINRNERVSFSDAVRSFLAGNALGIITPARVGELGRVAYLPVKNRGPFLGLVMLDKIFDLLSFVVLAAVGSVILLGYETAAILLVMLAVAALVLLSLKRISRFMLNSDLLRRVKILRPLAEVMTIGAPALICYQILALLSACISITQCYLLVNAFQPADFGPVFFTFPLVILTNIVPFTISGLGVREGAAVMLLSGFGIAATTAFSSALLIYFIDNLIPGLLGVYYVTTLKLNRGYALPVTE
jgi:glycosyltransferase 2 family protein